MKLDEAAAPGSTNLDLYHQYALVTQLQRKWPSLGEVERANHLSHTAGLLSRFAHTPRPQRDSLFLRLLGLPDEEIYEALYWTDEPYQYEEGEEIYDSLKGFLGDYLRWSRMGNAPLGYHFWSGCTALGAACQRRIFIPAGRRIYLNFYTILGGHKSTGKGQATDAANELLEAVNESMSHLEENDLKERQIFMLPPDITMESMVTELASRRKLKITDSLGQRLIEESPIDATGFLWLDELATFFGKGTWAVERRAPFLVHIKESNRYRKSTKKDKTEELRNLAVSILAGCAPDWMQNTIPGDLLGGGFLDRCVWIYRDPVWARRETTSIITSPPKDPLRKRVLAEWLRDNICYLDSREPVLITPQANATLHSYYLETLDREKKLFDLYGPDAKDKTANRLLWIAVQLATLISLSEEKFPPVRVSQSHAELAVDICRLEDKSLKSFLDHGSRSKSVYLDTQVLEYLRQNDGCSSKHQLMQIFRGKVESTGEIELVLKNLRDQGTAEVYGMGKISKVRVAGHKCVRCEPDLAGKQ